MSTTRSPPGDDQPEEIDPHGIVPDSFLDDWDADSIREAMRKAESAPSTSNQYAMGRCPCCGSTAIVRKGDVEMEHKEDTEFGCADCSGCHFDEPAPTDIEAVEQHAERARQERPSTKERYESSERTTLDELAK